MKFILVPVMMMLLLMQTFSSWMVVLQYQFNKEFISKTLCINKARPKLLCHGKCQMMKKLAEEDKQNSQDTNNTAKLKLPDVVFNHQGTQSGFCTPNDLPTEYNEYPPTRKHRGSLNLVFHPPALG